jgi:hypothetical protein
MVNYSNGKVYKIEPICEHDEGDVYYGSTTKEYLSQRMDGHRRKFNRKAGMCSSQVLFQKYGVENCVIILLESVDAKTNDELKAVEAKYIINNLCVNKQVPLRTKKQYRIDTADNIKERDRVYRDANKDKIKEINRIYIDGNVEKIREQRKVYYDANRDKIKEKDRQRYLKKKEHFIYIFF